MTKLTAVFLFGYLGLTSVALGQKPKQAHPTPGILGYFDPQTGTFKPLIEPEDLANPAVIAPTTGKFVFDLTIKIASAGLTTATVSCGATVIIGGTTPSDGYEEDVTGVASTGSGASRSCSVTIPYSWLLSSPATDAISIVYYVIAINDTTFAERDSSHTVGTIKVPATGATTTETFAVTI
jgi:hypothetical protein